MGKGSTEMLERGARKGQVEAGCPERTIGLDLGDRWSHCCELNARGEKVQEGRVPTTKEGMRTLFGKRGKKARVAMEVGTHSPWVSRQLKELGHEVLVANPRKLALIFQNRRKQDKVDAEALARVARMDPTLLGAVEHRPERMAYDLAVLRSRDALVRTRTLLVNHVRGALKTTGLHVQKCSTRKFDEVAWETLTGEMREALSPVVATIGMLNEQIREMDLKVQELSRTQYPVTQVLRQVAGVGPLIALAFVLTLQDAGRFKKSRSVGPYLGLVPAKGQSGKSDPQLRITKEGDMFLRRLLVQGAQYILGPFGPDCDLKRFGLAIAGTGSKNAKKRAVVAVARKLAVLLHRLWRTGEEYEPFRQGQPEVATAQPAQATA